MLTMVEAGLRIDVDHQPREVVVALRGELDVSNIELLHRALSNLDPAYGATVVVDCGHLSFIGAAGIGAIASAAGGLLSDGHRLQVVGLRALARQLFLFSGLDFLLPEPERPEPRRGCRRQPRAVRLASVDQPISRTAAVRVGA